MLDFSSKQSALALRSECQKSNYLLTIITIYLSISAPKLGAFLRCVFITFGSPTKSEIY